MWNPVNSEPRHTGNPGIFGTLTYLKPHRYLEPSQRLKMECFIKIVKSYNYFSKAFYLRFLTGFWIHPPLNKYSLICRVTLCYVLHKTYPEPSLLLYIQTYSGIFTSYSGIFSHIMAYLEHCIIFAYSESWHT